MQGVTSKPWELIGVSKETWRRWRRDGRTPPPLTLPGKAKRWLVADVMRWAGAMAEAR
jgi:hypothetical protein